MKINERIKARRRELGMTADELAKAIGKNRATVYRYENTDIENMPITVLEPIAKALHTTPASLMGWEEPAGIIPLPKSKKYRILGTIACGTPIEAVQESGEEFSFPDDIATDVCLRCSGNSMTPTYQDGDIVFIKRQPTVENGQIAAVYVKNGAEWDITLKKVIIYPEKKMVVLRALNPDFEDMIFTGAERAGLEVYGLAVALYRKA
ncbi:MAG: helix-turn-helix domain-containing protein [Clostridia bacterium]|nr:helix-turn-helix domain-containing protein [Clostridia bacterium]